MKQISKLGLLLGSLSAGANAVDVEAFSAEHMELGYFDTAMERQREDGRLPHVQSEFELRRIQLEEQQEAAEQSADHPLLSADKKDTTETHKYTDVPLGMMWDYNHVVKMRVQKETKDLYLIPTMMTSDIVLSQPHCEKCNSLHGAKWAPKSAKHSKEMQKKKLEYTFMMHMMYTEVEGHYYKLDACLEGKGTKKACGRDLLVYTVEQAKTAFDFLGEGILGLSPGKGYEGKVENSVLHQMVEKGMMSQPVIGVHTHNFNSTTDHSQIRFGEGNKKFYDHDKGMFLLRSSNKENFQVVFDSAGFHTDNIWKHQHALIDPSYPYIALPDAAWKTFHDDLSNEYTDEFVTCTSDDWCYFHNSCEQIQEKMAPLKFTFPLDKKLGGRNKDMSDVTFSIPAKSFLFNDVDRKTKEKVCHVGVIKQKFNSKDGFILGSAFMENFYVVYDARHAKHNIIALNYNGEIETASSSSTGHGLAFVLAIIIAVGLIGLLAIVSVLICVKKRQADKLTKAKAYFNSLKTEDDPDQLSVEDTEEADRCEAEERLNPNGFVSNTRDKTDNSMTVGSLL